MSQLVDKLAGLVALGDRDALDVTLVATLNDLLRPQTAAIHRILGDARNERWLTCDQLQAGQFAPARDAARSELGDLPVLATYPLREQAAATRQIAQSGSGPSVTVFPLGGLFDCPGVLELGMAEPMP